MRVSEQYEKETGKQWMTNHVCHGELGFASWEYQLWLENKIEELRMGDEQMRWNERDLENIIDEDIIACAKIARIDSEYEIEKFGGRDDGGIDVRGKSGKGRRALRIYYNGSNTRCVHDGFEVIEYCFEVYNYLRSVGYNVQPNKKAASF